MTGADEIARKLPVWHALSELFLDTELQPADYERIAAQLRASPYGAAEIGQILEDEVTPAFVTNLLSVAGEWAPWSEAEVREIMAGSLRARGRLRWVERRLFRKYVAEEWVKILSLLEH